MERKSGTMSYNMDNRRANHYQLTESGIIGTVDTAGFTGDPVIDISVDGEQVANPGLANTTNGIEITAVVEQVDDSHTVHLTLLLPRINLRSEPQPFTGLALLTTARTSIGGEDLVDGALQRYEIRPVGGTADAVVA